jgi:hypothetical protein
LLNIQLATAEFGPPIPSWRAASSTDARTILESRVWNEADDADDDKDVWSRRWDGRVDAIMERGVSVDNFLSSVSGTFFRRVAVIRAED